jgi:metal-sulfur cluster biosynthetic enzyme
VFLTINEMRKWVEIRVVWTPTTPSCGFAMNIALCIHAKLQREFSQRKWLKVEVKVAEGRHDKGAEIDK